MQIPKPLLYSLLILIPLQWTAVNFAYDFPQVFESALIQNMNITTFQIELLYSIGSIPNIFANYPLALAISAYGIQMVAVVVHSLLFAGVVGTYFAVRANSYPILLSARILVGLCFDMTFAVQLIACERWFSGKFLTFSYGLGRSFAYISTSMAYFWLPKMFIDNRNLEASAILVVCYCFFVFMMVALYAVLDLRYMKFLRIGSGEVKAVEDTEVRPETLKPEENEKETILERNHLKIRDSVEEEDEGDPGGPLKPSEQDILDKKFTLKHMKYLTKKSWVCMILVVICVHMYFQFTNTATDLLTVRFGLPYQEAKNTLAIIPTFQAVFIPFFSIFYSKFGLKPLGVTTATVLGAATYMYLSFLPTKNPGWRLKAGLASFSFFFSMFVACLWASLVISVPKQAAGFMIGLTNSLQNLLFTVLPLFFSLFYGPRTIQAYQTFLYAMAGYCLVCFFFAALNLYLDLKGDKLLMLPENSIKVKKLQDRANKRLFYSVLKDPAADPKTEYATFGAGTTNVWKSVAKSHASSTIVYGGVDYKVTGGGEKGGGNALRDTVFGSKTSTMKVGRTDEFVMKGAEDSDQGVEMGGRIADGRVNESPLFDKNLSVKDVAVLGAKGVKGRTKSEIPPQRAGGLDEGDQEEALA